MCVCAYVYIYIYIYIYACSRVPAAGRIGGCRTPPPPMVPHPCTARKAAICAATSLIKHEFQCLTRRVGDGDAGSFSFDGTDDEDDDDNDDVEHDVKDDPIVDSRRRLEHHNIQQYHRCHSKKEEKE